MNDHMSTFEQDALAVSYYQEHTLTESVQFRMNMYRDSEFPAQLAAITSTPQKNKPGHRAGFSFTQEESLMNKSPASPHSFDLRVIRAVLEAAQDAYDLAAIGRVSAHDITIADYVNERLLHQEVHELDGFGRRVKELYVTYYDQDPMKIRRFNGDSVQIVNVYTDRDRPLLDLAWAEQELAWKLQEIEAADRGLQDGRAFQNA